LSRSTPHPDWLEECLLQDDTLGWQINLKRKIQIRYDLLHLVNPDVRVLLNFGEEHDHGEDEAN
jgi:hypothetical protein